VWGGQHGAICMHALAWGEKVFHGQISSSTKKKKSLAALFYAQEKVTLIL
jgi:hypothetical protein